MPHATSDVATNGDKIHSEFIKHLTSYPVVNDGIETYKSNPYGKKSLEIANETYTRFGKPVEPYLQTPYSYAKPLVQKADELGNITLDHVDDHFPIFKEDTNTLKSYVLWPYNYLNETWQNEYSKTAQGTKNPGIFTLSKAVISTELRITSDFIHAVADFIGPRYEQGKKQGADLVNDLTNKADSYRQYGEAKVNELSKQGQSKFDEAKQQASETKDQAKSQAQNTKEQAKGQAQGAKQEAQKKLDK